MRKQTPGSGPRREEGAIKQTILPIIPFGATAIDTLISVENNGRLQVENWPRGRDKSERSLEDAQAARGPGTACARAGEQMLAAVGALDGAAIRFEHSRGVPFGGVLCALGALLSNGLLGPAKLVLHYRLLGETVAFSMAAPPQGQNSVNPASQR